MMRNLHIQVHNSIHLEVDEEQQGITQGGKRQTERTGFLAPTCQGYDSHMLLMQNLAMASRRPETQSKSTCLSKMNKRAFKPTRVTPRSMTTKGFFASPSSIPKWRASHRRFIKHVIIPVCRQHQLALLCIGSSRCSAGLTVLLYFGQSKMFILAGGSDPRVCLRPPQTRCSEGGNRRGVILFLFFRIFQLWKG